MIKEFANGMIAMMLAKFVLNDVPHALGLPEKEPLIYTMYHMRCPRKEPYECGYEYRVNIYTRHEWEWCPVCGYGAPFEEFVKHE